MTVLFLMIAPWQLVDSGWQLADRKEARYWSGLPGASSHYLNGPFGFRHREPSPA